MLVGFRERHNTDKRAALHRNRPLTNQSAKRVKSEQEVAQHALHPRSILMRFQACLRECSWETVPIEFNLYRASGP